MLLVAPSVHATILAFVLVCRQYRRANVVVLPPAADIVLICRFCLFSGPAYVILCREYRRVTVVVLSRQSSLHIPRADCWASTNHGHCQPTVHIFRPSSTPSIVCCGFLLASHWHRLTYHSYHQLIIVVSLHSPSILSLQVVFFLVFHRYGCPPSSSS